MYSSLEKFGACYEAFLRECRAGKLSEPGKQLTRKDLPDEVSLQSLWLQGVLGDSYTDDQGRPVAIVHSGVWNRGAGPDFLNALIRIGEKEIKGDIELEPQPEDWEKHGHGSNPNFNNVVLHVALLPSSKTWFTRNERHEIVPLVVIPADIVEKAVGPAPAAPPGPERFPACRSMFAEMGENDLTKFLQSISSYRLKSKRKAYRQRCFQSGIEQTLYECIAETLGYAANRTNMLHLAKRAPLNQITEHPEALLFGTAGFLVPALKETCGNEARAYHKELWDYWWKKRETFELSEQRVFPWVSSGLRPANHPQRRLAALALLVSQWKTFQGLCSLASKNELFQFMTSIGHPYWTHHVTLPSPKLKKPLALIGKDRARDFIINHIVTMDESPGSWPAYLLMQGGTCPAKVLETAKKLLRDEQLVKKLTKKAYQQQAFLQIYNDFCIEPCSEKCSVFIC